MNARIKVCQGCRGHLKSAGGNIQPPPFDYCVARRERRQYKDDYGQLKTPSRPSDAHYHLRVACVKAAEPSFDDDDDNNINSGTSNSAVAGLSGALTK